MIHFTMKTLTDKNSHLLNSHVLLIVDAFFFMEEAHNAKCMCLYELCQSCSSYPVTPELLFKDTHLIVKSTQTVLQPDIIYMYIIMSCLSFLCRF